MDCSIASYGLWASIVSVEPNIVLTNTIGLQKLADGRWSLDHISAALGGRCCFLIHPAWSLSDPDADWNWLSEMVRDLKTRNPEDQFFILNNEYEESVIADKLGFRSLPVHQNCFATDKIYNIIKDSEKKYKAIYNAKIDWVKRHDLASKIENLALIYHRFGRGGHELLERIKNSTQAATFLNGPLDSEEYIHLSPHEISEKLNESRVGLCLSSVEGAMWASVEYMLCGLPVVSTHSKGGRDVFFDYRFCRIVDDNADAVANAVDDLIACNIDPEFVREETLKKINAHRRLFIEFIARTQIKHGRRVTAEEDFERMLQSGWNGLQHISLGDIASERQRRLEQL